MAYTNPRVGDRVRFTKDLGGHLKQGCIGVVWEVADRPEREGMRGFPLGVLIPWVREQVPPPAGFGQWKDGRVTLAQFQKVEMIPMHPDELEFIDNMMGGQTT